MNGDRGGQHAQPNQQRKGVQMAGVVAVIETKTAARKRRRAEQKDREVAEAASRGLYVNLVKYRVGDLNRAYGETCSDYWANELLNKRSTPAIVVMRTLAALRAELATTPPRSAHRRRVLLRIRLAKQLLLPCMCRTCVKRFAGRVIRWRKWPAYYVGTTTRPGRREKPVAWSYECYIQDNPIDDVDHAREWSTSSPTVASMEIARRLRQEGKRVAPPSGTPLETESETGLKGEIRRWQQRHATKPTQE